MTASLVVVLLAGVGTAGGIGLGMLLFPRAPIIAIYAAVLGLGLIIPFGLIALLLRQPTFGLWRGVSLTLALAGGYVLLSGEAVALDLALRYPGLPATLPGWLALVYGLVIILVFRRRFLARPALSLTLAGLSLGLMASIGWLVVGSLGNPTEAVLSLGEALGHALLVAVLMRVVFFYDEEHLSQYPFWSALLVGAVFAGLSPALIAGRGYGIQGVEITLSTILTGFIAGSLLARNRNTPPSQSWWALLAFFFLVFLLPFALSEGFEGDWMIDDLTAAWAPAVWIGLVSCCALSALGLGFQRYLARRRAALGLAGLAVVLGLIAYFALGLPGIQPYSFFVVMVDQADTTSARTISDHVERFTAVYTTLTEQATQSQADIRTFLDARQVDYTPYYIVSGLEVRTYNPFLSARLAARPDVARILDSPHARPIHDYVNPVNVWVSANHQPDQLSWGIESTGADQVWSDLGVTGEGIVVGLADSGVDAVHPALSGQRESPDYSWYDPWYNTPEPTDAGGHGTHTMGTILGQGGIGMAPGAHWIACRNLARNLGNPGLYLSCMQFLLAPFPAGGDPFTTGDPSRGADLTSNSWGCPPQEGCDGQTLPVAIAHLYDAGQMFVAGAGNDGPRCSTVDSPAIAGGAFTVGAVDSSGQIAFFSSRGPATLDGSGRIKPDVAAPGVNVLSSVPHNRYATADGTSMATPHVAGLVALMWSANPSLIGDIDTTEQIIEETAHPMSAPDLCGAGSGDQNNVYGYGIIDAYTAVRRALETP